MSQQRKSGNLNPVDEAMDAYRQRANLFEQRKRASKIRDRLFLALDSAQRREFWQRADAYDSMVASRDPALFGQEE